MSNTRWGCAANAVGGQLCVVEGYGKNDNIFLSEEIYDPQTGDGVVRPLPPDTSCALLDDKMKMTT